MLDGRAIEKDVHRCVSTINVYGTMKPSLEDHGIQQQREPSGSCSISKSAFYQFPKMFKGVTCHSPLNLEMIT